MRHIELSDYPHPKPKEVPLEAIRSLVEDCRNCPLADTRNMIVFGDGNPDACVMLIGEAPGRNEDLQGVPFVGAAGRNLDGLLGLAGLGREDVYIANVLKCRPPGNRDPRVGEIDECSPYLREQIRSVWPDVIVCLGNFAAHFVMHTDRGITSLRGRLYDVGRFKVLPIMHPASALYHREWQRLLEDDFRMLGDWLRDNPPA